jgi:hypothetical protein
MHAHLPFGRMNRRTRMDDSPSEWLTYEQAAERLHVSAAAVRARAMRGGWRRQPGNDGKARVLITADVVRAAAEQPREQPRKVPSLELVNELRAHIATLKADNERLNGDLVAERQRADRAIAGLTALARERTAARQADQEQLAAAQAAADKATAELVALAQRLAEIAVPEPPPVSSPQLDARTLCQQQARASASEVSDTQKDAYFDQCMIANSKEKPKGRALSKGS